MVNSTHAESRGAGSAPGERAATPAKIPPRGWWQIARRSIKATSADNVPILAAGVAFFAFLAIPPALIAALTLYGLIADPQTVAGQMERFAGLLPEQARPFVTGQLNAIASSSNSALGIGLVVSLLGALWSASTGTSNLVKAVNIAYDEDDGRGFLKTRLIALALTLGAIVFVLLTLFLVAVVPPLLGAMDLGVVGAVLAEVVRWGLLIAVVVAGLAVVYRIAPDRDAPQFRWTSPGALVAVALWLLASLGFSLYVNNFGSYNETYGALAGVVVFLLWLYLTGIVVLLGAEINHESEKQTSRDTTVDDDPPTGRQRVEAAAQ